MPDGDADDNARGRLPSYLFWGGVGVAPLAGLLMLLGSFRIGGFLGMTAVVLIAASMAMRPDVATVRLRIEETLLEEVDVAREELRGEIGTSARATHQMVGERIGALQQTVNSLRAERGAPSPGPAAASAAVPPPQAAAPPGHSAMPAPRGAPLGRASAGAAPVSGPVRSAAAAVPNGYANGAADGAARVNGAAPVNGSPRAIGAGHPDPPPEPRRGAAPEGRAAAGRSVSSGGGYGAGRRRGYQPESGGDEWSTVVPQSAVPEPPVDSWSDRASRDKYAGAPYGEPKFGGPRYGDSQYGESQYGDSQYGEPQYGESPYADQQHGGQWPVSPSPTGRGRSRRRDDDGGPAADRSGGRWAATRDDDSPGDPRAGERRGGRRGEPAGDERWSGSRWDEGGYGQRRYDGPFFDDDGGGHRHRGGSVSGPGYGSVSSPGYGGGSPSYGGDSAGYGGGSAERPDYSRRALPAASSEPSWNDSWEEPERPSGGRRHRDDRDDEYGGSRRQFDFGRSDERWR